MPVPKRQWSKKRTNQRAAGKKKVATSVSACKHCQAPVQQHSVCQGCGFYRGIKVMVTKAERSAERELDRKARRQSLEESSAKRRAQASPAIDAEAQDS